MMDYRQVISKQIKTCTLVLGCAALLFLVACAPAVVMMDKPVEPGPMSACCSATGHNPDNIPFALGGNCFCTPGSKLVEAIHAAGHHQDVDYKQLVKLYHDRGIMTDFDHRGCNNLCENGPHVAFGGKCMATPTPGTKNFERVLAVTVEQVAAAASGM